MVTPEFKIGEKVYHDTTDSEQGIVTDIIYYYATKELLYKVAIGWSNEVFCRGFELTREKVF